MILIMGGTVDAREIVRQASLLGYPVIATTATEYGAQLLNGHGQLHTQAERLDPEGLTAFIRHYAIDTLIDATHPYAEIASRTAIDVCHMTGCHYIRYERKTTYLDDFSGQLIRVRDYQEAAKWAKAHSQGQILLTVGSKSLEIFAGTLGVDRLIVRILPVADVIEQCYRLCLKPNQIIAMQGPFSCTLNIALIEKYDIKLIVGKDSGEMGGTPEKLSAANYCKVPFLLIDRPQVHYPNCVYSMHEVFQALNDSYKKT